MISDTIGNITLLNGDCLEFMRTLPDKAFSLAIVDPPYGGAGADSEQKIHRTGGTWATKYGRGIKNWDVAPTEEYFRELFRISENQIIWGANYFALPPTRGFVVWDKRQSEDFTMAMAEYAWTSFNRNAKIFRKSPSGLPGERFHPTQKPVELYKWLLSRYANEGDTILDTHGGSMSSMIACMDGRFTATCIELDPTYYNKAKERLMEHSRQLTIF